MSIANSDSLNQASCVVPSESGKRFRIILELTDSGVPPLVHEGIEKRDLSEDAQTINQRGTTIVPLEVKIPADGDVYIRAKDPAYATPGPDEVQKF